jgi:hypothetical protein
MEQYANPAHEARVDEWRRIAREVLVEAMRRLRLVTSGLRDEPVTSFEKALVDFLNRVCADGDVHLVVIGDETWAPPRSSTRPSSSREKRSATP